MNAEIAKLKRRLDRLEAILAVRSIDTEITEEKAKEGLLRFDPTIALALIRQRKQGGEP